MRGDFALERNIPEPDLWSVEAPFAASHQLARERHCAGRSAQRAEIAGAYRNGPEDRRRGRGHGRYRRDREITPGLEEGRYGVEKTLVGDTETGAQRRPSIGA